MNDKDKKITYSLLAILAGLILLALLTLLQAESLSTEDIRPISTEQVDPPGSGVKIGSNKEDGK
jgi:heme/copper-type cytochrome/quinol oxidase subunit 1